jgi:DNA-binding transcriptional regulator YiaG
MKLKLSNLIKGFNILNQWVKEISTAKSKESKLEAPEEVKASRFTRDRIRSLRNKLGMSQRELSILTGASVVSPTLLHIWLFCP